MANTAVGLINMLVGKSCIYHINGLHIACTITDAKSAYGTVRVEICPNAGSGSVWVLLDSVRVITGSEWEG